MTLKPFISVAGLAVFLTLAVFSTARADMDEMKKYKEAFPGEKPKCASCHLDALPKKDDGKHELNAYGKKVYELGKPATVENYKQAGKA
ncbi:MAG: hypothetical protein WC352_08510 [Candidatus Omnitrophota bacterium]|jgi:hypothetical protein